METAMTMVGIIAVRIEGGGEEMHGRDVVVGWWWSMLCGETRPGAWRCGFRVATASLPPMWKAFLAAMGNSLPYSKHAYLIMIS